MGRYVPRTYKNHRWTRIILRVIVTVVLAVAIIFATLFFALKKYIVYYPDGLRLEIPFLMEDSSD